MPFYTPKCVLIHYGKKTAQLKYRASGYSERDCANDGGGGKF